MTAERRFLREALLALGAERPGLLVAARSVRSWDRAVAEARAGSVSESVWAAMARRDLAEEIPEPARSAFREDHLGATARNALLLAEAASVQDALAAAGLDSIVLKGPGLLVAHYPDIGARHMGDVDLLVRERDLAQASRVLRGLGAREGAPAARFDGTQVDHAQPWECHSPAVSTANGVALELHRAQPGEEWSGSDFDGLLARSRLVAWQGRSLRIPSPADLAAGAALHVFDHHEGQEKYLPRLLGDLAVTIGAGAATWREVEARMSSGGGPKALSASRRLLDEGPPGGPGAWRHAVAVRVRAWEGRIGKRGRSPGALARILFPARGYMAIRYRVPEASPLLPLLYLWRPVRGLWALVTGR